jgi:hypothetical protein
MVGNGVKVGVGVSVGVGVEVGGVVGVKVKVMVNVGVKVKVEVAVAVGVALQPSMNLQEVRRNGMINKNHNTFFVMQLLYFSLRPINNKTHIKY